MSPRSLSRILAALVALALVPSAWANGAGSAAVPSGPVATSTSAATAALVTLRLGPTLDVVDVAPSPELELPRSLSAGQARARVHAATDDEQVGYVVEVLGPEGGVVHRTTATLDRWIRTESSAGAPGAGPIVGIRTPDRRRVATVAVPAADAARVRVLRPHDGALRATPAVRLPAGPSAAADDVDLVPLPGYPLDHPENRIDLVILADGYTSAQANQFAADARRVADQVLEISPYADYLDFFNVVAAFAPSAQSGADHPPYQPGCTDYPDTCCPESAAPTTGTWVSTRYESTYCGTGVQRGMVARDLGRVEADASAVYPAWDHLMVVVNDAEYGGTGGYIATTSVHDAGALVMQHELGHSLLGLADEYTSAVPGIGHCSDAPGSGLPACAPNVTDATDRATLKWRRWVQDSTPIPTASPQPPTLVGLFQGANYDPVRYYRSCDACIMNFLDTPFGPVAAEQMPIQLYRRGFTLVEPGTASPAPGIPVEAGSDKTFTADVISPGPGPGTRVRWMVDGQEVETDVVSDGTVSLDWRAPDDAAHVVQLEATDVAGILHPTRTALSASTVSWQVGREGTYGQLLANGGFERRLGQGWATSTVPATHRKCSARSAHTGKCALRVPLQPRQGMLLAQSLRPRAWQGDRLTLSGAFDSADLRARVAVIARVRLDNGEALRLVLDDLPRDRRDRQGYLKRKTSVVLPSGVSRVDVQVRLPKGRGMVGVDSLALLLSPG